MEFINMQKGPYSRGVPNAVQSLCRATVQVREWVARCAFLVTGRATLALCILKFTRSLVSSPATFRSTLVGENCQ